MPRRNNPRPNPRVANGHRRRQLRAQVLAEEDLCWLCGGIVDKSLPAGHPMAAEVDEIVPVSLGGNPYERSNCRLAHRLHNQQRGDGRRHRQRRRVPTFIASCQTGAGPPDLRKREATHGLSATDAAPETTGSGRDGS